MPVAEPPSSGSQITGTRFARDVEAAS